VRAGAEVVIEEDRRAVAVIRNAHFTKAPPGFGRLLSECIALAEAHGSTATLDSEFGKDLEEIIAERKPLDTSRGTDPQTLGRLSSSKNPRPYGRGLKDKRSILRAPGEEIVGKSTH
jgi:hypothetical protein